MKERELSLFSIISAGLSGRGGGVGGCPAVESVDTSIHSSSASVEDESADSVTNEVSEQDDEEADFEAAVSQEGSKLPEATKKRRALVAEMLNTRKDNKINQKLTSEAQFLLSSSVYSGARPLIKLIMYNCKFQKSA